MRFSKASNTNVERQLITFRILGYMVQIIQRRKKTREQKWKQADANAAIAAPCTANHSIIIAWNEPEWNRNISCFLSIRVAAHDWENWNGRLTYRRRLPIHFKV